MDDTLRSGANGCRSLYFHLKRLSWTMRLRQPLPTFNSRHMHRPVLRMTEIVQELFSIHIYQMCFHSWSSLSHDICSLKCWHLCTSLWIWRILIFTRSSPTMSTCSHRVFHAVLKPCHAPDFHLSRTNSHCLLNKHLGRSSLCLSCVPSTDIYPKRWYTIAWTPTSHTWHNVPYPLRIPIVCYGVTYFLLAVRCRSKT